jgi:hypothetical protein
MKANLYLTDLATLPPAYAALDLVYDDGHSAGWQSTTCGRCSRRFRDHDWVVYLLGPEGEAVSDCSLYQR